MRTDHSLVKVRIWDLPTRLFHWALVLAVVGLFISGNIGGNAMVWHFRFGLSVGALLLFRLVWGVVGGHWSRFASFIYSPRRVLAYLTGKDRAESSLGHSPLAAGSVFAMLLALAAQVLSGLHSDDTAGFVGPLTRFVRNDTIALATNYHKEIGKVIVLVLIVLHLVAIAVYQWRRHRLVGPMLHGDKLLAQTSPTHVPSRDDASSRVGALVVFAACAALMFWVSTLG